MRRIVVIGSGVGAGKLAARVKRLLPGCEVNMIMPEAEGDGTGNGGPFSAHIAGRRASRQRATISSRKPASAARRVSSGRASPAASRICAISSAPSTSVATW